jgi:hypothetical protein
VDYDANESVLLRALTDAEYALLRAIWIVAFGEQYRGEEGFGQWQTWDYIWRSIVRSDPEFPDPDELLAQLPEVNVPNTTGRRYGLVWTSDPVNGDPSERIVGLTIAGMQRLSEEFDLGSSADILTQLVASIAKAED